jgi:glucan 1,3-beta-glucosidase
MFGLANIALAASLLLQSSLVGAYPTALNEHTLQSRASSYWVNTIARQGTVWQGTAGYQIYRNVMNFGAKG